MLTLQKVSARKLKHLAPRPPCALPAPTRFRREAPCWQWSWNLGGWPAAYVAIFSSIIQPTGQSTNFAFRVTDFFSHDHTQLHLPNFPLTKKCCKNNLVYFTWARKTTPTIPQFLKGVSEILCIDIRCSSWKYEFGHIFKITWRCAEIQQFEQAGWGADSIGYQWNCPVSGKRTTHVVEVAFMCRNYKDSVCTTDSYVWSTVLRDRTEV